MTDVIDAVRDHYAAAGLTDRLASGLSAFGPVEQRLTPQQLAPLDQFHSRGVIATAELAKLAGIAAGMSVVDIGAGIGGPARFLAETCGCKVSAIDLSAPFVDAARYLTARTGQSAAVSFETASALDLPFDDGRFDAAMLLHVAMNIHDRPRLYRETRRVLKAGGRFATFDVVTQQGEPHFPVPWARSPSASFLLSADATRTAIEHAGFRVLEWKDDTDAVKAWIVKLRESGPPPAPNLGLVVGPDFPQLVGNMGRSLMEGRIGVLMAVFEATPVTVA